MEPVARSGLQAGLGLDWHWTGTGLGGEWMQALGVLGSVCCVLNIHTPAHQTGIIRRCDLVTMPGPPGDPHTPSPAPSPPGAGGNSGHLVPSTSPACPQPRRSPGDWSWPRERILYWVHWIAVREKFSLDQERGLAVFCWLERFRDSLTPNYWLQTKYLISYFLRSALSYEMKCIYRPGESVRLEMRILNCEYLQPTPHSDSQTSHSISKPYSLSVTQSLSCSLRLCYR